MEGKLGQPFIRGASVVSRSASAFSLVIPGNGVTLCLTRIFGRTVYRVPRPLSIRGQCRSQTKARLSRSQVDITPQRIPSSRSIVLDNKVCGHLIALAQGGCTEVAERRRSAETTEGTVVLVSSDCNYNSPPLPFLRCIVILIPSILQSTRIRPC